ncbi:Fic family protein [Microbacterium sp. NEAU-LLC]|uniref:Fic family protein n=1 Tax=Microbacterium helvum TaxID=2773713 RepID=A0ABR8NTP8_9MICO|nr:Fic family protein [Microbacterium helvum]
MIRAISHDHTWPAHRTEIRDWRQSIRSGSRADRTLRAVAVSIPPRIAELSFSPPTAIAGLAERALIESAATDGELRVQSRALPRFMLRTESVASSKIERVSASATDFARAIAGSRANTSATSMVAASTALHGLVETVGDSHAITLEDLLSAHRTLMRDDAYEAAYAGRWRDMQNWIGGSDHSPRDALYVPPPPEMVEALMRDLLAWANRDDVPVFVQLAIAHAQFESIHPFTDGNGRLGRALVSALLRRRGVAQTGVMPLASGLLAVRDEYFAALMTYRSGDPSLIVALIARAAGAAAVESRASMRVLTELPGEWRAIIDTPRGSVTDRLLEALLDEPVLSGEQASARVDATPAATYAALDRLVDAGILAEVTGRKRDRVWAAGDVLGELDELDRRIQGRMLRDG